MSQFSFNFGVPPIPALAPLPVVSRPYRAQLLTNNEPCLDSEVPHIQNAIDDCQGQIGHLDVQIGALEAQIRHLQATLEQCQRRRKEVSERVRQHQSIMSPIRRVPAELLCEIFSWTWSGEEPHGIWATYVDLGDNMPSHTPFSGPPSPYTALPSILIARC
ncbi:hypothetical protein DFH06DRAFT_107461 [Mycena polygramma]|nr:hypothetical protein DFH06DRAFT_107461 [Mycena polygramma]